MSSPEQYGQVYYCVKVPESVAPDGEIYVHADHVGLSPDGSIILHGTFSSDIEVPNQVDEPKSTANLILAAGQWIAMYAASQIDGSAVAVERWEGEVVR